MHFIGAASEQKYLGFTIPDGEVNHPLTEFIVCSGILADQTAIDIRVAVRGFFTDHDGELFRTMLRQLEQIVSKHMPPDLQPSTPLEAERILILFHADGRVEAWINEKIFTIETRVRRGVNVGDPARLGDISDIESVRLVDLEIPEKCGFAFFCAFNGHRCLVFDLRPTQEDWDGASWDPIAFLAASVTYLFFHHQLSLTELEWQAMIDQGWFPFMCLDVGTVDTMIRAIREGIPIDSHLPRIVENVRSLLPEIRGFFSSHTVFERHRDILDQSLAAYERGEYALSNTALLVRTEGLMRELYARVETGPHQGQRLGQRQLLNVVARRSTRNPLSLLRPQRFAHYLRSEIFAEEDFANPAAVTRVTRHSVAHGVAGAGLLNEKSATISLLCLYQIGILASRES